VKTGFSQRRTKNHSEVHNRIFRPIFRHEREKHQDGGQISIDCIEQLNNLYLSQDSLLIVVAIRRRGRHRKQM